jgi:molybdopterin synthase catalytic subunit
MHPNINIEILSTPPEVATCLAWVQSPSCGGIDIFIGTVRNATKGKPVEKLEFEAYLPMAIAEMEKIAMQAMEQWPVQKICIQHRTGILTVGEIPVIIAVAAAHRSAAFEACRYVIDTLKQTVPIWKKEFFADGAVWVAAHP